MKTTNSNHIELFRRELEYRNYSPRTVESYTESLLSLQKHFSKSLDEITVEQFKGYLHLRMKEQISTSSINQCISAFKHLQVGVFQREWEAFKIKRPRRVSKLPIILSTEEVERLISVTSNVKHRAILMIAYSAGLRKMEIVQITPSEIDSQRMQIHVKQGKGKKDRYTILSPKTLEILRNYYKLEKPKKYLFEPQGKKGSMMADRTIDAIINQSAAKAGIKKNISFHTLRHCFATHLLEQGVNLRVIQSLLGHTSLRTTAVYLHLANVDPTAVISPMENMNI